MSASAGLEDTVAATAPAAAVAPGMPATIGRYEIRARLGAGGMGVVYRAFDPRLAREVAVKVLRGAATEEAAARLVREAQAMARVAHDNLVVVYDAGAGDGELYLAMELVEGASLRAWWVGRPWRARLAAALEAGRGLAAAHAAGVVHRDFKPDNVLVDRRGRAKVTDFGLARGAPTAVADDAAGELTLAGAVMGTPGYMAPEQYAGEVADARADQFALAVVVWEAIFGQRPFAGRDLAALADAATTGTIAPPPAVAGTARLEAVLRRALAVDPAVRFASVDALLAALALAARPRRRVAIAIGIGVVATAAIAVAIVLSRPARGSLAPAVVDLVFTGHAPEVAACLADGAPAPTTIELDARGEVVAVDSTNRCLAAAIRQWELPHPGGPLTITRTVTRPRDEPSDAELVRAIVRAHVDELQACYESRGATRAARLDLAFEIDARGAISKLEIARDDFPSPQVAQCVNATFARMRFVPDRAMHVPRFPFVFAPSP